MSSSIETTPMNTLDELIALLADTDLAKRQQAAIALSNQKDPRLITPFLQSLQDADPTVRANVISGLGVNRATEHWQALLPFLQDSNDIVRERTIVTLAQLGDTHVIPYIMDMLDDKSNWVRNRAIYVLGASNDPRAIDSLLELLNHKEPSTQGVSAWALGSLGARVAIPALLKLLKDPQAQVRGNAAWALGELGDEQTISPLISLLQDKDAEVRGKTAWALGNLGHELNDTRMLKPLLRLLDDFAEVKDSSAHTFVCQYVAEALLQLNLPEATQAVDAWRPKAKQALVPYRAKEMLKAFASQDNTTRDEALNAIVQMGDEATATLLQAFNHKNPRVRQYVVRALGDIQAQIALPKLVTALADDDIGVWSQAVAALVKFPNAPALLQPALKNSPNERVKWGCALALWRLNRTEEAFPYLLMALQNEDIVIQGSAITSLWLQPDERALATLQIILTMEDTMMNRYIAQALSMMGTATANSTLQHWLKAIGKA
jgi:HEAT repeat protein